MVQEIGPSGTLAFEYDVLDRLRTLRVNGSTERTVTYDTAPKGIGLPATVTDTGGAGVRTALGYDALVLLHMFVVQREPLRCHPVLRAPS